MPLVTPGHNAVGTQRLTHAHKGTHTGTETEIETDIEKDTDMDTHLKSPLCAASSTGRFNGLLPHAPVGLRQTRQALLVPLQLLEEPVPHIALLAAFGLLPYRVGSCHIS